MSFGGMNELLTAFGGAGGATAAANSAGGIAAAKGLAGGLSGAKAATAAAVKAGGIGAANAATTAKALSMGFKGGVVGQKALGIGALKGFNPAKVGLGRAGSQVFNQKMNNLVSQNIGNTKNFLNKTPNNFGKSIGKGLKLNQGGGLGSILKDPDKMKALMTGLQTVQGVFERMEDRRRR